MSTELKDTGVSPEVMADAQVILECVAAGIPVPFEVSQRVHERAEEIRSRVFRKHGLVDIGVPAIRELRGPLPES